MGVTRLAVRIGSVTVPRGRGFDAADLGARVEAELRELLAQQPLRRLPEPGVPLTLEGGAVPAPSLASPAAAAHAIACRIHTSLQAGEAAR